VLLLARGTLCTVSGQKLPGKMRGFRTRLIVSEVCRSQIESVNLMSAASYSGSSFWSSVPRVLNILFQSYALTNYWIRVLKFMCTAKRLPLRISTHSVRPFIPCSVCTFNIQNQRPFLACWCFCSN
jgi:hypothetical protein